MEQGGWKISGILNLNAGVGNWFAGGVEEILSKMPVLAVL